jgi:hypothetical protein
MRAAILTFPGEHHTEQDFCMDPALEDQPCKHKTLSPPSQDAPRALHSVHALIFPNCRRSVKDALRGTDVVGSHVRITVRRGESSEETVTLRRSPMSYVYLIQVHTAKAQPSPNPHPTSLLK